MTRPRHAKHALYATIEFSTHVSHPWGTLVKQHLLKSECACNIHWHASNAHQTRSVRIQCACKAIVTGEELI